MAYDGGKLIESPNTPMKSNSSMTPTISGVFNGIKGQDLQKRTSSSAACDEKNFENVPGGPSK